MESSLHLAGCRTDGRSFTSVRLSVGSLLKSLIVLHVSSQFIVVHGLIFESKVALASCHCPCFSHTYHCRFFRLGDILPHAPLSVDMILVLRLAASYRKISTSNNDLMFIVR